MTLDKLDDWFVDGWRKAHSWWSVRMNAIGVVLYPLLVAVQALPPEIQALFPVQYRAIGAGLYAAASLLARIYAQPKKGPTDAAAR